MKKKSLAEIRRTEEYENLRLALNEPNIFNILKIEEREIRHSNFLAWLLDPKESHGLNEYFLKWFLYELSCICEDAERKFIEIDLIEKVDWRYVSVYREEPVKSNSENTKFLDIFITYEPKNGLGGFTLTIENKIWTKDSKNQLSDYYGAIERGRECVSHYPQKKVENYFIYLTPEGDFPQDENMVAIYIPLGYDSIYKKLKWILDRKKDWISDRSVRYITDYIENLEKKVLNCNEILLKNSKKLVELVTQNALNEEDEVIKYAKNHCDLNEGVKNLLESKGYKILAKECSWERIRFLPKQLPEMLEKFRVENEKDNGVDNQHLPNYSLIVFELKIERNEGSSNIVRFGVTVAPSKYHSELRTCIDENLKTQGYESIINKMLKGAGRWHSVLKPCVENKNEYELEEYVECLLSEKKPVLDVISKSIETWASEKEVKDDA